MPDQPSTLKVKQRAVKCGRFTGRSNVFSSWGGYAEYPGTPIDWSLDGTQITASEGHRWNKDSNFDGEDIGGPFETTKQYLASDKWGDSPIKLDDFYQDVALKVQQDAFGGYIYRGMLIPMLLNSSSWPSQESSSDYELMALGSTAIARVKPTNSIADLSVSLAELLREGLPSFPGRSQWEERAKIARGAGSEYLNAQFGWLPLVSEVQNVAKAISQSSKIWKQYERDAGKLVRRRYEFPVSIPNPQVVSEGGGAFAYPVLPSYYYPQGFTGGNLTRTRYKRQKRVFSGAFTYYIPDRNKYGAVSNMLYAASKARRLYGLTLDPEVLWNLTPWSWATDWFLNTGDVLSNISDFASDGLLLRYGYMMEETIVSDEISLTGLQWSSTPSGPASLKPCYLVTKTKKRIRATPYGFGLTFEDFTPRQLAIMASLGITRFM